MGSKSVGARRSFSSHAGSRRTTASCSTNSWRATARPLPRISTAISSSWHATPLTSNIPANTIPVFLSPTSKTFTDASPPGEACNSVVGKLLAQHFELQPPLFRCGDFQLQFTECSSNFLERGAVARIELRIGEPCLQPIDFGLQLGDGFGQRFKRMLVRER